MSPFTQYFVEAPLAAITALSLLGYDATSLTHLYLGSFSHSPLLILSSPVRLDEEHRCTTMLHCRDGAKFPPEVTRAIQAKEFTLGFIRPEKIVSHGLSPLGTFWQTPSGLSCAFY